LERLEHTEANDSTTIMKPASFEYCVPASLEEALQLLAQHKEVARPLAGGQSLVPLMNFRLARPAYLVDLNGLNELNYLRIENGDLLIGAMTRQRALERSAAVVAGWPLLQEATRHIGHVQIRNRGTVGGSLAHAYPSAELPVAMVALDASFRLRGQQSERMVQAREFFVDAMSTVLEPGELLVEIHVPKTPPRTGSAFQEISRRHGDFALAVVASTITLRPDGTIDTANLVFGGAKPTLSPKTGTLVGKKPDTAIFNEVANDAAAELEPESDIHASADYRKEVSKVLARRALEQAATRASEGAK
jgi:CO/xanthine dehydrogenase FAD-binding subunit